jgi:large subunit ribosomal protein L18
MAHAKLTSREKRKVRIRKKIDGTAARPRLTVYRSNRYLYAQVVDDVAQHTMVSASTLKDAKGANKTSAAKLGEMIGELAKQKNVSQVTFDRNGYRYHGVIKEIAEAARKAGLVF